MTFAPQVTVLSCDGDGRDHAPRSPVPADPFAVLAEKCRKEFCRRWHEDHGDAIDTATEMYK